MKLKNSHLLLLIVLVGSVLRLYNITDIPFTHDEFSALFRTEFDSFTDLIRYGVRTDTHPAGVQVFMYYWIKIFGTVEWVVKLPFIVAGIGSIYLFYRIGKLWFNDTVGLLSAAILASIQYSIIYSQIARPYGSGLFLTLAMVYFWTRWIYSEDKKIDKDLLLYVLFSALSAYNHHFSLLFAAIVGVSGLLYIPRSKWLLYSVSGLVIFLLYVPHLSIFFSQLEIGGITWLAKPHLDFVSNYFQYIFQFSMAAYLLVAYIFVFSIVLNRTKYRGKVYLAFLWFSIPLAIGLYYSITIKPVLQYSMLIFSFPYLFFVLFGFLPELNVRKNLLLVVLLLGFNTFALVVEREHYTSFYESSFEEPLLLHKEMIDQKGVSSIIDLDDEISFLFIDKFGIRNDKYSYYNLDDYSSVQSLRRLLSEIQSDSSMVYLATMYDANPNLVPIVKEFFPKMLWQKNYVGATCYLFENNIQDTKTLSRLDFDTSIDKGWNNIDSQNITLSIVDTTNRIYVIPEGQEYSPSYTNELANMISHHNDFIDISLKIPTLQCAEDIVLVCSMKSGDKDIYWGGTGADAFKIVDGREWSTIRLSVKLSDLYQNYDSIEVKICLWNKGRKEIEMDDFEIEVRTGNPRLYGLIEEF